MSRTRQQLTTIESDVMRVNATLKAIEASIEEVRLSVLKVQVEVGETIRVHQAWTRTIVDSLVEFTLAKSSQPQAAAMHRSQVRMETKPVVTETLATDPTDKWPPPGSIVGRSIG